MHGSGAWNCFCSGTYHVLYSKESYLEVAKLLTSIMAHGTASLVYNVLSGLPLIAGRQKHFDHTKPQVTDTVFKRCSPSVRAYLNL